MSDTWHLYVLQCADGTLYCGVTVDVNRRLVEHNTSTRGAKYTRSRRPVELVDHVPCHDKSAAFRAEARFKSLKRCQKIDLLRRHALNECLEAMEPPKAS